MAADPTTPGVITAAVTRVVMKQPGNDGPMPGPGESGWACRRHGADSTTRLCKSSIKQAGLSPLTSICGAKLKRAARSG